MTPEILLMPHPTYPSACVLGLLRWLAQRDGVGIAVVDEEQAFHLAYETPHILAGWLVHVPHGLFPPESQLKEQLRLAGVRWNYLPPLPHRQAHHAETVVTAWEMLLPPGALSQWLAQGTPEPWQRAPSHARAPEWCRIPTIPASEVPRWH